MAKFQVTAEQINRELVISFCDISNIQQSIKSTIGGLYIIYPVFIIPTLFVIPLMPITLWLLVHILTFSLVYTFLKREKYITQLVLNKSQNTVTEYFWRKGNYSTKLLKAFDLVNMDSCIYKVYPGGFEPDSKYLLFSNSLNPKEKYMYRLPEYDLLDSYNKDIITTIDTYLITTIDTYLKNN
jgi:hypothetical protein